MTKNRPTENFPVRLRRTREKRALSQAELAQRAGLQASAVSHFETGIRKPSFDNLRRLVEALEVTTDYLFGRVSEDQALAGADRLHLHLDRLTTEDLEVVEKLIKFLASRRKRVDNGS